MKQLSVLILAALLVFTFAGCGGGGGSDDAVNESFTISYDGNGHESGTAPASQRSSGDSSQSIQNNTGNLAKAGYLFDGWNTATDGSGKDYAPGSKYKGANLKLYAKWAAIYKVQNMGGSPSPALKAPGSSNLKILGLTEKGKTLTSINIPAAIDGNTIKAIGSGAFQGCSFITELTLPATVTTIEGNAFSGCTGITTIIIPASVDTIGDGAFSGCSNLANLAFQATTPPVLEGDILDGITPVIQVPASAVGEYTTAMSAYGAHIEGSYTVTFDTDGGSEVPDQVVTDGELAVRPSPDPTKADSEFAGWYNGLALFDFDTPITENITLTAHWNLIIKHTVTFNSDGGSPVASQAVRDGHTAAEPTPAPTRAGFNFMGWYNGNTLFDFGTPITGNITLTAHWLKEDFVKVNGGTVSGQVADSKIFIAGRTVNIRDMYVCNHEVTQKEFKQYMKIYVWPDGAWYREEGSQYNEPTGDNYPVFWTSWYSAVIYCNLRSVAEGLTPCYYITIGGKDETDVAKWMALDLDKATLDGEPYQCFNCEDGKYYYNGPQAATGATQSKLNYTGPSDPDGGIRFNTSANGYRLPTEVEWEYIARGGLSYNGMFPEQTTYSGSNDPAGYVAGDGAITAKGFEIKTKAPNTLGIYDMSGNAYEHVWDWWTDNANINASTPDTGPETTPGGGRIKRGGAHNVNIEQSKVYYRLTYSVSGESRNSAGFRVVRNAD